MNESPENRTDGSERPEDHAADQASGRAQDDASHRPAEESGSASDAPRGPQPPQPVRGAPTPPEQTAAPATPAGPAAPRSYAPPQSGGQSSYAPPMPGSPPAGFGGTQPTAPYGQPDARQRAPQGSYVPQNGYNQPGPQTASNTQPYPHGVMPVGQPQPGGAGEKGGEKKKRGSIPLIAALAVGALVGGVSGAGVAAFAVGNSQSGQAPTAANPANVTVNDGADATIITAVAASAGPSVVTLSVADASGQGAGTGSGVILSDDGFVLTNAHVVTLDGASASPVVSVQTADGRLYQAEVVGTDPVSDLAVVKMDGTDFQPIDFADSSQLNVGDTAVAIGSPLGLANTVTNGIVSSLNRSITVASSAAPETPEDQAPQGPGGQSPFDFWQFGQEEAPQQPTAQSTISLSVIQTDAAINPGNSGGALLDAEGDLIGINVAIAGAGQGQSQSAAGNIGVGFAIPSNLAERIAQEIIETGTGSHGLLGASVNDVTASDAAVVGAQIVDVSGGGAAANAGLRAGDIVTMVDDIPITNSTDLTAQIRALAGGAETTLTYVRDGDASTVDVTLGDL